MKLLKYKADVAIAQLRALVLAGARQILAVDQHCASGWQIEAGEK